MIDWTYLITLGSFMILLGFLMVAFGMARQVLENAARGEKIPGHDIKDGTVKGAGVILIGPVPVVFGTDKKYAALLMILAIVLMLLAIMFRR